MPSDKTVSKTSSAKKNSGARISRSPSSANKPSAAKRTAAKSKSSAPAADSYRSAYQRAPEPLPAAAAEPFEPTPEKNRPFSGDLLVRIGLYALAAFVCVCYMFPATAGLAGKVKSIMCGLFGAAGFLLPVLMIAAALFLPADRRHGYIGWRAGGSLGAMISLGMFLHGFSALNILETLKLSELWKSGIMIKSGGAVGGFLGSLVYRGLGRAGVFIISLALIICVIIIIAAISKTEELTKALESFGRGIDGTGRGIKGVGQFFLAVWKSVKKGFHSLGMRLRRLIGLDDNSPDSADVDQNRTILSVSPVRPQRVIRRPSYSRDTDGYSGVRPSAQAFDGAISEIGIGRPPENTYSSDTGEYIADSDRPYGVQQPAFQPSRPQRENHASPGRIEKHRDYVEIFSNTGVYQKPGAAQTAAARPARDMGRIEFNTPLYDTGTVDMVDDGYLSGSYEAGEQKAAAASSKKAEKRDRPVSAGSKDPDKGARSQPSAENADKAEKEEAARAEVVSKAAAAYAAQRRAEAGSSSPQWLTPKKEYTSVDRNGYRVPTGYCDDPRVYAGAGRDAGHNSPDAAKQAPKSSPDSAAEIYNDISAKNHIADSPDDDEPVVHPVGAVSVSELLSGRPSAIRPAEIDDEGESADVTDEARDSGYDPESVKEDVPESADSSQRPEQAEVSDPVQDAPEREYKRDSASELIPDSVLSRFISGGNAESGNPGDGAASGESEKDVHDTESESEKDSAPEKPARPEYRLPPLTLLKAGETPKNEDISEELNATAKNLTDTLKSFKVSTHIVDISRGPTITRYELQPDEGVRVKQILNLVDDISLNLATAGVRIEAPIPGKSAVGVEVPNKVRATVWLRSLLENPEFRDPNEPLRVAMGMDVAGKPVWCSIDRMPHMLIAGATGMGKSVCINSMVISLLYRADPEDVKMIMIDPKKVELNVYNGLPHLLLPVVSEPKRAAGALQWAVNEMERRYTLIERTGVRNIEGYNREIRENPVYRDDPDYQKCPYIVIFIDELADLMMTAPDSVEDSICRIAQKARAAGMHLVIGTQRPSVDVITGLIKANVPSRAACKVSSQMDSRVILDVTGAEKLIGRGDMLFAPVGAMKPIRIQGSFVSDKEVEAVVKFIKDECEEYEYDDAIQAVVEENAQALEKTDKKSQSADIGQDEDDDPMLKEAIKLAVDSGKISTSLIQRRLSLGYGRAAKLIDRMEEMGVVSEPDGQKPRTVLITRDQWREMTMRED